MKEIKIQVRIEGDTIVSAIKKVGFDSGKSSSVLEIVGLLEYLKQQQLDKIKRKGGIVK